MAAVFIKCPKDKVEKYDPISDHIRGD